VKTHGPRKRRPGPRGGAARPGQISVEADVPENVTNPISTQEAIAGLRRDFASRHCGEDLSEVQEEFRLWALRQGVPFALARSRPEAMAALNSWGALLCQCSV
jgi:hypothetical protein